MRLTDIHLLAGIAFIGATCWQDILAKPLTSLALVSIGAALGLRLAMFYINWVRAKA